MYYLYMISKSITRPAYLLAYLKIKSMQNWTSVKIEKYQVQKIFEILCYSRDCIPYYSGMQISKIIDIRTLLSDIPILTKTLIRNNYEKLGSTKKIKATISTTGGSTGEPLKYRLDSLNRIYASILLDKGLGLGGYKPGRRMVIIAGGSLVGPKKTLRKKIIEKLTNVRYFSSYGMDEDILAGYVEDIIKFNPEFIRGYASAIGVLADYIGKNNLKNKIKVKAIFSTSEMLTINNRKNIENIFSCKVFDGWGLNDGGASAFECNYHDGMHLDFERAYVEILDENDHVLEHGKQGRIVITNLIDKSMPFIRYDSGDIGYIEKRPCDCGRETARLFISGGRITDRIEIGKAIIAAPVLTVLMGSLPIKQYQIAKTAPMEMTFRIVKDDKYDKGHEDFIVKSLRGRVANVNVRFEYLEFIPPKNGNKYKFIIDETVS